MFTGIVLDIGKITAIDKRGDWIVTIATRLPLHDVAVGASISHSGICLTVLESSVAEASYKVQLSEETLSRTTALRWRAGSSVNLERALRIGDELGGHYVSGHVDGVARVIDATRMGDSLRLRFDVPKAFAKYIAPKGSITIDGVSLTVNEVDGATFGVAVIPHTQKVTTLGSLTFNEECNFEIDMLARYVERMRAVT